MRGLSLKLLLYSKITPILIWCDQQSDDNFINIVKSEVDKLSEQGMIFLCGLNSARFYFSGIGYVYSKGGYNVHIFAQGKIFTLYVTGGTLHQFKTIQ